MLTVSVVQSSKIGRVVCVKVLLVPNYSREVAVSGARELEEWLFEQGCDVQWAHDKKLFPDKVIDCSCYLSWWRWNAFEGCQNC